MEHETLILREAKDDNLKKKAGVENYSEISKPDDYSGHSAHHSKSVTKYNNSL